MRNALDRHSQVAIRILRYSFICSIFRISLNSFEFLDVFILFYTLASTFNLRFAFIVFSIIVSNLIH